MENNVKGRKKLWKIADMIPETFRIVSRPEKTNTSLITRRV